LGIFDDDVELFARLRVVFAPDVEVALDGVTRPTICPSFAALGSTPSIGSPLPSVPTTRSNDSRAFSAPSVISQRMRETGCAYVAVNRPSCPAP
jgi:hypothetical protein